MIESQQFLRKKSHRGAFVIDIELLVQCCYYPGLRDFSWFFTAWESCERAAKRWTRDAKRWTRDAKRRERKTSGHFGLQSHFYANAGSVSDPRAQVGWYFYQHANQYDWSVWSAIPRARWGYLLLQFLCRKFCFLLYQGKNLLAKHCSSQFIQTFKICVFYIDFVSDSAFEGIWPLYSRGVFQRLKVSTNIKALLAVINRKDMFAILPTEHRKSIYCNSVHPWCRQIPVPDRLFIPSPCHNFDWVFWSFWWHFNEDVTEHHLLKEAYAFLFRSREAFLQNVKLFSCANNHVDPGQVRQNIPLFTTRVDHETLAADKHVIAKRSLVPFWIIKLTRLIAGVEMMKVRLKSKVTRRFSFSPQPTHACDEDSIKTSGTRECCCTENSRYWVFLSWIRRKIVEGGIILNSTLVLWHISDLEIKVSKLQDKPSRSVIPSCYARKCDKMASFWLISPETGPATFRETQIAMWPFF